MTKICPQCLIGFLNRETSVLRNIVFLFMFTGLLLLFFFAYTTADHLKQEQHFSQRIQQADALQNVAALMARRRGLQAVENAGISKLSIRSELEQLDQMLVYSLSPLLHEKNPLVGVPLEHVKTLQSCISSRCLSEQAYSPEALFNRHSLIIRELLDDAQWLLGSGKESWHGGSSHHTEIVTFLNQAARFAESVGQVRGRLSARLAGMSRLDLQALSDARQHMQAERDAFFKAANLESVKQLGLQSYTTRNRKHFSQFQQRIDSVVQGVSDAESKEFFDIASRYITDIQFMRNQVIQHFFAHINQHADTLNTRLFRIGSAGLLLFLLLIAMGVARARFSHQKTQDQNLELNFLKRALDQHAIVSMTDAKGDITYINDRFCEISGYQPGELLGRNHRIINSGVHDKAFFGQLWSCVHRNEPWAGEVCNRKKNGELYWVYATVLPLFDNENRLSAIISVRTDITRQKMNEALLLQEKENADAASRAKSDFLANMSHEIRTPMNAIIGLSHLAISHNQDAKTLNYLNKIKTSADNLLVIINDILDFSKIEAGKIELEDIPFSPRDCLQQVMDLVRVKAKEKQLPVYLDMPEGLVATCLGDPLRLNQVLLNLMSNAIKFTEYGEVRLSVEQQILGVHQVALTFRVSDTGIGISEEKQKHLFEAFSQEDTSTTRLYGGTGLGLSISQHLTHLMGGQLTANSRVGEGSCFSFTLILTQHSVSDGYRCLDELRVLHVDDDPVTLCAVKRLFSAQGIEPDTSEDPQAAYQWIIERAEKTDQAFDLVLLDQEMPGLTGLELASRIRENLPEAVQPVMILLTGNNREALDDILNRNVFDGIWLKPISASEILDDLQTVLKLHHKDIAPTLKHPNRTEIRKMPDAKVLVAEDNAINQDVICGLLEFYAIRPQVVSNGQDAVSAAQAEDYDLILMDLQMPVMDGLQATLQILASKPENPPIIVAMTANAMASDRLRCLDHGMSDHISKPIDPEKLQAVLYHWLPESVQSEYYVIDSAAETPAADVVSGIDFTVALRSANRDVDLLRRLLISFVEQYQSFRFQVLDHETLGRELHTLKGLSGTLGMTELQRLTAALEQEHKKLGSLTLKDAERLQASLEWQLQQLQAWLESGQKEPLTVVDQNEQPESEQAPISDDSAATDIRGPRLEDEEQIPVEVLIEDLKTMLREGDSESQDVALRLMLATQSSVHAEDVARILEYTDQFDFDNALLELDKLEQQL